MHYAARYLSPDYATMQPADRDELCRLSNLWSIPLADLLVVPPGRAALDVLIARWPWDAPITAGDILAWLKGPGEHGWAWAALQWMGFEWVGVPAEKQARRLGRALARWRLASDGRLAYEHYTDGNRWMVTRGVDTTALAR
jgi:hypothetical protein